MRIQVENFMGCRQADLNVSGIALAIGLNHQGKSSLCRAAGAALSGLTLPLGLRKSSAGMLVHSGTAKASATVEAETGKAVVNWPKAERHTEGQPPFASAHAVGMASLVDMDAKAAVDTLTVLLKAAPTQEDLAIELKKHGVSDKAIEKVWEAIDRDGWDLAHKRASEKGRELKAQWDYATGEKYGVKKGGAWVPGGWDETLATSSSDSLEAMVTTARAELEDSIATQAVDDDTKQRLIDDAADLEATEKTLPDLTVAVGAAESVLAEAEKVRADLPPADNDEGQACPHCGEMLVIENVWKSGPVLKTAEKVDEKTLKQRRVDRASADGKADNARAKLNEAKQALSNAQSIVGRAQHAQDRLDELAAKPAAKPVDVDACRETVRKAETDLKAFNAKTEADRLHRNVCANQAIIDALAQTGVRQTVLLRTLDIFNTRLQGISDECGWDLVSITPDMTQELGGRPYVLLSASEQYRVRVTIQVAIAELDGSEALVFDAAEVLDGKGRSGLLRMLHNRKHRAIIGMMLSSPDKAPDLAAMGAGVVYWIDNGMCAESRTKGGENE